MKPANRNFWLNKPKWSINSLVFLLRDLEPALDIDASTDVYEEIMQELKDWECWSEDCPALNPFEVMRMSTPVNTFELLNWANGLAGVTLPDWMLTLIEPNKKKHSSSVFTAEAFPDLMSSAIEPDEGKNSLGDKERKNLLTTIGVLSLIVVEKTGKPTGDVNNPNISGLSRLCAEKCGEMYGMAEKTLNERIKLAIDLLQDRKLLASNK